MPQADVSDYAQSAGDMNSFGAFFDQTAGVTAPDRYGTTGSPYCPNGDLATGGGAISHDYATGNAWISSLIPDVQGDPHYWLETSNDVNPPSYGEWAAAYAVCANGTVAQIPTTTTLVISPTPVALNALETLTATVTPQSGTAQPTGTVTFYDGTTPLGTSTLSGGVASMTTSFRGGAHSLTAVYSGDTHYPASTSSPTTFTIACTLTIAGPHQGGIAATSGTVCVSNAWIGGGIAVAAGVRLDIENSMIAGSISMSRPATVRLCGSHTQTIAVTSASGYVRIGDPADNCAENTIAGSVTAVSNTGGGTIAGNTISGTITASANTPTFTINGNHP